MSLILSVHSHQEYKDLDLNDIKKLMRKDPVLIDGRATFDPEEVVKHGFHYRAIGRGQTVSILKWCLFWGEIITNK